MNGMDGGWLAGYKHKHKVSTRKGSGWLGERDWMNGDGMGHEVSRACMEVVSQVVALRDR